MELIFLAFLIYFVVDEKYTKQLLTVALRTEEYLMTLNGFITLRPSKVVKAELK